MWYYVTCVVMMTILVIVMLGFLILDSIDKPKGFWKSDKVQSSVGVLWIVLCSSWLIISIIKLFMVILG